MIINKTMKNLRYFIFLFTAVIVAACDQKDPQVEQPDASGKGFKIEVMDLHSSHCKVKVTPEDMTSPYFCGVATEDYLKTFGDFEDMQAVATNFIETTILENSDLAIADLMKKGEYIRDVTGLKPEQRFVVFACHTDEYGAVTSEVAVLMETTPALEQVEMSFEIELDQITATSAMLFITPTTDDDYVWLDPNGANRSTADCVADAKAVAEAVTKPIVIMGCKHLEKDAELFGAIAEALAGKNVLFMSAKNENYKTVGASVALANGQKVGAETADDINLAKQLNIMLKGLNVPADSIVMNIGTAAVGYGYEYVASTLDRVRAAALAQSDADLQMPIIAPVSTDTWGVKESTASEADEPAWGSCEERAISMEVSTAAANLTGGADAVIMRHPAAVATIKKFIAELI